ncbi:hypothetical protein TNCV_3284781 [Trichonephila clavipes]|nr:hypothetical protein TNCV_3284781 [Trichonephila clavipes]
MNAWATCAPAWTLSLETMVVATLDIVCIQWYISGVINDEPGCTNDEMSIFQINSCSVYSIKIIASVFSGIVVNAHWHTGHSPGVMVWGAIGYTLL